MPNKYRMQAKRYTYTIESSNLFIGEIVKIHIEEDIIDDKGKINYQKLNPIIYAEKKYYNIRESIGYRGFSKKLLRE